MRESARDRLIEETRAESKVPQVLAKLTDVTSRGSTQLADGSMCIVCIVLGWVVSVSVSVYSSTFATCIYVYFNY